MCPIDKDFHKDTIRDKEQRGKLHTIDIYWKLEETIKKRKEMNRKGNFLIQLITYTKLAEARRLQCIPRLSTLIEQGLSTQKQEQCDESRK